MFQAKYSHPVKERKEFTIESPKEKIKFKDFLKGTFKRAIAVKHQDDQDQEMSENQDDTKDEESKSNVHQPPRISCFREIKSKAPHQWLCDGRYVPRGKSLLESWGTTFLPD